MKACEDGLRRIHDGGRFIFEQDEQSQFVLTFEQREESQGRTLCNIAYFYQWSFEVFCTNPRVQWNE
jgi:hypothetical protein